MKVAIIPARGGSKRIPRKNIKPFCGKPMIAWSIEAAQKSGCFDRILISTDDREIAEVAKSYGAEAPFLRPASLADDHTGTVPVVAHAIQWLQDHGHHLTAVCCIYATAPFLTGALVRHGYDTLRKSGKLYAFTVTSFPFPIQRAVRKRSDGGLEPFYPEYVQTRSQDLEGAYHDAGQFYWGLPQAFVGQIPVFSPEAAPVIVPRHLVQDIDTPEDWERAELMYRAWTMAGDGRQ